MGVTYENGDEVLDLAARCGWESPLRVGSGVGEVDEWGGGGEICTRLFFFLKMEERSEEDVLEK